MQEVYYKRDGNGEEFYFKTCARERVNDPGTTKLAECVYI